LDKEEIAMSRGILKVGAIAALLISSTSAYADDPTGLLLRWRGQVPTYAAPGQALPAFSDNGPCQPGMQQESFPNQQGYRCIRMR
jgi:hypothetical protein